MESEKWRQNLSVIDRIFLSIEKCFLHCVVYFLHCIVIFFNGLNTILVFFSDLLLVVGHRETKNRFQNIENCDFFNTWQNLSLLSLYSTIICYHLSCYRPQTNKEKLNISKPMNDVDQIIFIIVFFWLIENDGNTW